MQYVIPLILEKSSIKVMHHDKERVSIMNKPAKYSLNILLAFYLLRFLIFDNINIKYY